MVKKMLQVGALCLALTGCAGTDFSFGSARMVQVGMTQAQVQQIMGPPYMVSTREGKEIWVWSYASAFGGSKVISFSFKDGKVDSVPTIPSSF